MNKLALLLIGIAGIFLGACADQPKNVDPPSLGAIVADVSTAKDFNKTATDIAKDIDKNGAKPNTAQTKKLVATLDQQQIALTSAQQTIPKLQDKVNKVTDEYNKASAKVSNLERSRNRWVNVAYWTGGILFAVAYLISSLTIKTATFAGWYGAILDLITKFIPLPVVIGIAAFIAGGLLIKSLSWIWTIFGFVF